jgi:soluble lytic murein transglycosylase-like protein
MGLMQIMPSVAVDYDVRDPFDPEQNLEAGMRYLRSLLQRFDDVRRAVAAYNAGPDTVVRYGGVPPYRETRTYVQRVMAALR